MDISMTLYSGSTPSFDSFSFSDKQCIDVSRNQSKYLEMISLIDTNVNKNKSLSVLDADQDINSDTSESDEGSLSNYERIE